ncbi:MAG: hypothetical protein Q7S55_00850 [Nanoarchaeota archaeon]|nr:hypothetical protein [Nanoarchaeota archaeon]
MNNRTLHLIVTDYDLSGFVRNYRLDELWTPKLVEAVDNLRLEPDLTAICYTTFSDETLEMMDESDILHTDVWRYRAEEYADPYLRPDDHFIFLTSQRRGGLGVNAAVPWACRTGNNAFVEDSSSQFHQALEGQLGTRPSKVGAVIDCTDHPNMHSFLQGLGYDVQRQEIFNFGPWPERK